MQQQQLERRIQKVLSASRESQSNLKSEMADFLVFLTGSSDNNNRNTREENEKKKDTGIEGLHRTPSVLDTILPAKTISTEAPNNSNNNKPTTTPPTPPKSQKRTTTTTRRR